MFYRSIRGSNGYCCQRLNVKKHITVVTRIDER